MSKKPPTLLALPATDIEFDKAISERYLAYALSTITSRSLPDVRDGLKPVHRRLLFAMRELNLNPQTAYKKCARVVGDVIGKYHPHGDTAVYETLARLAQDFAVRYPLVDGQGNFGNIDGDNPAAMRYTESRLTAVAVKLLDGLDDNAVDFRATYDGEGSEPIVLPAAFPNLLANGSSGIAVGMATNIPPHNVGEIADALKHLLKHPNATIASLLKHMPAPDFPTGGVICEDAETMRAIYETGRGAMRLRARWHTESLRGGGVQIVVTEIPYQVAKGRLIEKIAELIGAKKLPLLDDVIDESADNVRLLLIPKNRNVDADMLMESLFRVTDLEVRFGVILNALDHRGVPLLMNLRDMLQAYLNHRRDVLQRVSAYRLAKIDARLELLAGFKIAYLNLDRVIEIIRREDEPKPKLQKEFGLSDIQAEAILNMRLRQLRKLEEMEIKREHDRLSAERKELKTLLKDETAQWAHIADEVDALKKQFGSTHPNGKRRSEIIGAPAAVVVPVDAHIEREPVTVIVSTQGWARAMKGHMESLDDVKFKDGDALRFSAHCESTDKLLILGSAGRVYTLGVDKLPGGRGHGEPLHLLVNLEGQNIAHVHLYQAGGKVLLASSDGRGFIASQDDLIAQTRQGKQALNVADGATAVVMCAAEGDHVAVLGSNKKLLVFPLKELPEMARGRGVTLQKHKGSSLVGASVFRLKEGLTWQVGNKTKNEPAKDYLGARGQVGRNAPNGFRFS